MRLISLTFLALVLTMSPLWAQRTPAPRPSDYEKMASRVGELVQWRVNDPVLLEEGRNKKEVAESRKTHKGFNRMGALTSVIQIAKKEKKVVLLYVPRILSGKNGRQAYRPGVMDNHMMNVLFSDPDAASIVNTRFVPVRLTCDQAVGKFLNVTAPETLEPALFFLNGDGKVIASIDRIRTFNSSWFIQVLSRVLLREQAEQGGTGIAVTSSGPTQALKAAKKYLKEGAWAAALVATRIVERETKDLGEKADAVLTKAKTYRLIGNMTSALETLSSQDELFLKEANKAFRDAYYKELGRTLLLMERTEDAALAFQRVKRGPHRAEAQYHLGLCDFFDRRDESARRRWKDAAGTDQNSPYAWRAAANLIDGPDRTPVGPTTHGFEDPFFRKLSGTPLATTSFPRSIEKTEETAKAALNFLLRMQRENGGWSDSRYAYWGAPDYTPNVWIATSSLSLAALLDWRHLDPQRVDAAIERGEKYIFDRRRIAYDLNEEVYAHAYRLIYLAKKFESSEDDGIQQDCVARMNRIVNDLGGIQKKADSNRAGSHGAWAHEYPNPFTTAAAMNALHRAEKCGATVPRRLMIGGVKALLATRDNDGAYGYSNGRKIDNNPETRVNRLKDSMGRTPIAEAAIIWARSPKADIKALSKSMEHFWTYMPRLKKVRKCDFHTDGQLAGFFFWHVIMHTTEAIDALPADEQDLHRAKLHALMVELGEIDGSFIDSHEIGKSYGTAMGLISLKAVSDEKRP